MCGAGQQRMLEHAREHQDTPTHYRGRLQFSRYACLCTGSAPGSYRHLAVPEHCTVTGPHFTVHQVAAAPVLAAAPLLSRIYRVKGDRLEVVNR